MKKLIFTTMVFSTILTSCGQKSSFSKNDKYQTKVVLSAFTDMVSKSTLDESLLKDLPKLIDLSIEMTPAKDQADRGTCTIFSTIGLIEGTIKKDLGIEVNLSEEFLNYSSKQYGRFELTEGSVISENVKAMTSDGLLLEEDWSYQASWFRKGFQCGSFVATNKLAPKICFSHNNPNSQALERKIDAKNIRFNVINKNTNEIIKFLATKRRPLVMSVNVNLNAWPTTGVTDYNEKMREECITAPSNCGGHSILVTGYDMEKREFLFKNSWGKDWGKNGYGTIPFDVVDKYTNEVLWHARVLGEVKIPAARNAKLELQNFDVSNSMKKNKRLRLKIAGDVADTSGKMFYISSYLVKKHKRFSKDLPIESNTEFVRLYDLDEQKIVGDEYIRVSTHTIPNEENNIILESLNDTKLIFAPKAFLVPTVSDLLGSTYYDLALRTIIYVHGDENGFVELKRIYSDIDK